MTVNTYQPSRSSRTHDLEIGGIRYRCYSWGSPEKEHVWLLHGWADCALSYQFIADRLDARYYLLAPDWRGFGDSSRTSEHYWFPDYLADLESLIDKMSPWRTVALVGHSMGANVAALYAGIRPDRVHALVCLDGVGLSSMPATMAPMRYAQWLDEIKVPTRSRDFSSKQELVRHLRKLAPRLTESTAEFVAEQWATMLPDGKYRLKMDPRHRRINAVLYRREEAVACWREVCARTLFLFGSDSKYISRDQRDKLQMELSQCFRDCRSEVVPDSGHMLHLEAPDKVAAALTSFLT